MKRNGCVVAIVSVVLLLSGGAAAIYFSLQGWFNPYYGNRRVYAWAKTAIWDPDPAARREAAQALVEAFKGMSRGEPRTQLTLRFCNLRPNDRGEYRLPKEILPFLLETLHAKEMPPGGYASIALSQVEPETVVPALIEVVLTDADPHARAGAVEALSCMGAKVAELALRQAQGDVNPEVRWRASRALKEIERKAENRR